MNTTEVIETDQLRAFEAVASAGSFTRAARALGVPQSTLSQQITRLEARAGRLLIKRSTRHVVLTEAGDAMLVYAHSILGLADAARRRLAIPPVDGVLKIAIAEEFAATKLASLLNIFSQQYPRFEMRFVTARNDYIFGALEAGEVDVALGKAEIGRKKGEQLWREPLAWVGQSRALHTKSGTVPLLAYLRPSETRNLAEAALLRANRVWTVVAESANLLGLIAAAEAGLGVLPLGRHFIPSTLKELPSDCGLPPIGEVGYILDYHSKPSDPAVDSFAELLQSFAKQLVQHPQHQPGSGERH
jgi:DNA-binding transcriptional LysR family regulator